MNDLSEKQGGVQKEPIKDNEPDLASNLRPWTREEATAYHRELLAAAREAYRQVHGVYPKK